MVDLYWSFGRCWRFLAIGCLLLIPAPAPAQSLEACLLSDAADGELNEYDFISAALIASGVDDHCELEWWQASHAELRSFTLESLENEPFTERLAAIQKVVHKHLLVGTYIASASDLRTTIARGHYNCLTALAIELDLCGQAGLLVEICSHPGHVRLRAADALPITLRAEGHIALHQYEERSYRRLTPVELLGKFYYNRGVEQLRGGQFAVALKLLAVSLELDPADGDARENLVAGLNNWAVEHCRQKRYDLAAPLIDQGLSIEPAFAPLVANERLVREKLRQ